MLKATIEYDGSRYRGWQAQVNARTVQGALYEAIHQTLGDDVRMFGAGRTDAGVHAFAQVASLHLGPKVLLSAPEKMRQALNDLLPPDVHILSLVPASPRFHARHDAVLRIYRYRIARRRTAFGKPFVWWVKDPLDEDAMRRAAQHFVGRHDFSSFCENPDGQESTIVEVSSAQILSTPDLVVFRIAASHFLWKMVRRLTGILVEVGTGRLSEAEVKALVAERSPRPAVFTAPPSGLFLEAVLYAGDPTPKEIDPLRPGI